MYAKIVFWLKKYLYINIPLWGQGDRNKTFFIMKDAMVTEIICIM